MITRVASLYGRLFVAAVFLFTVTACGGGGGGGDSFYGGDSGPETYFLALTLLDSDGNPTNTVTSASPATLRVKVTKNGKNGAAIADVVVSAETLAAIISPPSGTALTNSSGIATFTIEAGDTKGAGTITATVDGPSGIVVGSISYQVGSSGLRLGYLDENGLFMENEISVEPNSILAAQAVAQLALVILDENGVLSNSAETVSFTSGCIASGQATLDPLSPIVSGDGKVNTSYQAAGCSGNDQITANLEGSTAQAFGTVTIASAQANGFQFVDAVPTTIVLKGTGNGTTARSEFSTVQFRVVDSNNSPIGGIKVDFDLTTSIGGLALSSESAISASDGLVKVNVIAGDIPTVVRVIASATSGDGSGQQVSTVSDLLTVTTGLPDQDSIGLSVGGGFVVDGGMIINGVVRTLTVTMSDKFNNPVTDGTAAVFTTEYGNIDPSCQTGVANGERLGGVPETGQCSVQWTSGPPRNPLLTGNEFVRTIFSPGYNCPGLNVSSGPCPFDLGFTRGGRSTVLVSAIGEESFIDRNGNGVMDEAEKDLFDNLPEAFLDKNEDRIFNPETAICEGSGANSAQCIAGQEEIFVDFNVNDMHDLNNDPAVYNGLLCPVEGDGVWCNRDLLNVFDDVVLILSDPTQWFIALFNGANSAENTGTSFGVTYEAYISDIYNSRPPAGSSVTLSTTGDCEVVGPSTFVVDDTNSVGAFAIALQTGGQVSDNNTTANTLEITLTPPTGAAYSKSYSCTPIPAPIDPNDPG